MIHYGQLATTGVFSKFDWGSADENIARYGVATPPPIKLENIKNVPLGFFVGDHDMWADPTDVHSFKTKCSTLKFYKEYTDFDHLTFVIGKDMSFMSDVISFLKSTGNAPAASHDEEVATEFLV